MIVFLGTLPTVIVNFDLGVSFFFFLNKTRLMIKKIIINIKIIFLK